MLDAAALSLHFKSRHRESCAMEFQTHVPNNNNHKVAFSSHTSKP